MNTEDAYVAVYCLDGCGTQYLTREQYIAEMNKPDSRWSCPCCHGLANYDDEELERLEDERHNEVD